MDYKHTLNLPETSFPMRASLPQREPSRVEFWNRINAYRLMIDNNSGKPRFILHDGPPYANGRIHSGTVLNKILKDFVVKYKNLSGFQCEFRPGWDCHGLPIENNVEKEEGKKKDAFSVGEFREKCRAFAHRFMGIQRDEFKRLGVLGEWERPYLTVDKVYEATIAREFGRVVGSGAVFKGRKPVLWCAHHATALAEAEVEYEDLESPAIYVKFLMNDSARAKIPQLPKDRPAFVVIWTTTPWTLPANLAITLNPELKYVAVDTGSDILILAQARLSEVLKEIRLPKAEVLAEFPGSVLERTTCRHPFIDRDSLLILGDFVTTDAGTGCVHTAPGHGVDDYRAGLLYGLDIYAPVDERGCFTKEVPEYQGRMVFETDADIIRMLDEKGVLLSQARYRHSYPTCQRCKRPIVFRATAQWFVSMEETRLRERCLEAVEKVEWVPSRAKQRIAGMLHTRPDWCISRQRLWGVPVIAFTCSKCGHVVLDQKQINHVADVFEQQGADSWYLRPVRELMIPGSVCQKCGHDEFVKETDILDVWFESGVSYAAVIEQDYGPGTRVDLYLEGSDQHRGWFQSTLLEAVATRGSAPYNTVLTHGFVVDGQGKKISKSLGNYIPPEKIINQNGAEIYRLWAAAQDYQEDIRMSNEIFQKLVESYMKIRNTLRYLLSNVNNFDPDKDCVPFEQMLPLDRYILHKTGEVAFRILEAYDKYKFYEIYQILMPFVNVDLSARYFDVVKDRLYVYPPKSLERESVRTAQYEILKTLVRLLAPILSFTAEEVFEVMPKPASAAKDTVFCFGWQREEFAKLLSDKAAAQMAPALEAKELALKAMEKLRAQGDIGHSLDASVTVLVGREHSGLQALQLLANRLAELFIVSEARVEVVDGTELTVEVAKAPGSKCVRCWHYSELTGSSQEFPDTCGRCSSILKQIQGTHE